MVLIEFTCAVLLMSVLAGLLGALTGLGGGVVIVPALALLFPYRSSLRHWCFAGFGHRHFFGCGGLVCPGRFLQRPHRNVSRGGHNGGGRGWRLSDCAHLQPSNSYYF